MAGYNAYEDDMEHYEEDPKRFLEQDLIEALDSCVQQSVTKACQDGAEDGRALRELRVQLRPGSRGAGLLGSGGSGRPPTFLPICPGICGPPKKEMVV
ncbi:hypothetical protein NDU88_003677 [Pleurodeles waltl]|uniref:Uncharacterized protein n=1 Tax=Pleurodeles waltl TaxID=8319 RepID=A0AAV7L4K1_PLEWA|nr:hypothetical protein NDU88_003677 [Pleurodeles waltl]